MDTKRNNVYPNRYSDSEYISGLKCGDNPVTRSFFYTLCGFTLNDIKWSLMHGRVDYDELVNELFLYLSANNWHKLDTFEGRGKCTLKSWMVRVSWRFFMQQRSRLLYDEQITGYDMSAENVKSEDFLAAEIAMDVESTFSRMENSRYAQVLKWMLVDGYDADEVAGFLNTSVANVYNIKHRAIVQFVETYNR